MEKSDIFWQTYLNLEKEVLEVSKYIHFTDTKITHKGEEPCNTQLETFSPFIADLLVRCCIQIESIAKELYFENGGEKPRGDRNLYFDDDCLRLINCKWNTDNKIVMVVSPLFYFTKEENKILKPLKKAYKKDNYWVRAYQAVKHDRFYFLYKGNVKALIGALAALYLLNIYYKNYHSKIEFNDISEINFSFDSLIFSVKQPTIPIELPQHNYSAFSGSPFVVKYEDKFYADLESIKQKGKKAVEDYIAKQPEFKEKAFLQQLQNAKGLVLWELEKYRLNKKIPSHLPFAQRKKLLIESREWNAPMHQNNEHLKINEITEENIQEAIDVAGERAGMELNFHLQQINQLASMIRKPTYKLCIEAENIASQAKNSDRQ